MSDQGDQDWEDFATEDITERYEGTLENPTSIIAKELEYAFFTFEGTHACREAIQSSRITFKREPVNSTTIWNGSVNARDLNPDLINFMQNWSMN